jgi:hypothetical protein
MWHVWGTGEVYIGLWWKDLKEGGQLEDLGVNERIIVKWILNKLNGA